MFNKCLTCNKETTNPKFCSKSCAAKTLNKLSPKRKLIRKCSKCENVVKNKNSTLCKEHSDVYQLSKREAIESLPVSEYTERECIKRLHPSSKYAHIRQCARSWFKHLTKLPCHNCGYDKHVELCHIKPISSFDKDSLIGEINSQKNIIQLCPNCHWEFDNNLLTLDFPDQPKSQEEFPQLGS